MMILALVRQQTAAGTGNASIAQAFVRTRCPLLAGSVNQRGLGTLIGVREEQLPTQTDRS